MSKSTPVKTTALFFLLIALVVILSMVSSRLWGGKPEILPEPGEFNINTAMTLAEFGQANNLPNPMLKGIFGLQTRSDLRRRLSEYGTAEQIQSLVLKNCPGRGERD